MTNPFVLAMRTNPAKFLDGLESEELKTIASGCVEVLQARNKKGDRKAGPALQALYRELAYAEI